MMCAEPHSGWLEHVPNITQCIEKDALKLLQALNDEKQSKIDDCLNDKFVKQWINTNCRVKDITKPRLVFPEDTEYVTCLCYAARANDASIVRQLVQSGSNVTITDSRGLTPLHNACLAERDVKEKVNFLLACDPSMLHTRTLSFNTPLVLAARRGHRDVISILIQHDADINDTGEYGRTPLHAASWFGHVACIDELVRLGADVEARDSEREATPLMLAATSNESASVDALINRHGASINAADTYGWTALHRAAYSGHIAVVRTLSSDLRCCYSVRDASGRTALDIARINGHTAVVELLRDSEDTALQYAARGTNVTSSIAAVHVSNNEKSVGKYKYQYNRMPFLKTVTSHTYEYGVIMFAKSHKSN